MLIAQNVNSPLHQTYFTAYDSHIIKNCMTNVVSRPQRHRASSDDPIAVSEHPNVEL